MQTHHISLLTKDANQNIRFYTHILGLRLVKNTVNQENIHIRHLFYGDNLGTPGSVVTFFVLPLLGRRTDGNHFINGIRLAIPQGSTDFWMTRLTNNHVVPTQTTTGLTFDDPDQIPIVLVETPETLTDWQVVPNNGIEAKNQITRFLGTELAVPDVEATATFFERFLNLTVANQTVQLDQQAELTLTPTTNFEQVTRFGRGSIDHVALRVADEQTLLDYYQKAQEQGWDIEMYRDRGWFKSLYIREPGDNRIELATPTPGFSLDEPILTMGHDLGLTPKFESHRQEILDYYATQNVDFHEAETLD
ncbi:VOC family protein [uncultured Secundilactobacillus sp.]|uniref:VOC family protein n=1 Tax=uncultured Secundilactobacillus sp. TaxID=2813935 RepID=UPI002588582B|nr:VOC family protein [uncultured Secundilactobacillus sp.]